MSAKKQIRLMCRWCCLGNRAEITGCTALDCAIYPFREGLTFKGESKIKAIKRKCADCLQSTLTSRCTDKSCPLYEYREGHRPKNESEVGKVTPKRVMTPEHLKKLQEARLKNQILGKREQPIAIPTVIKKRRAIPICPEKDQV